MLYSVKANAVPDCALISTTAPLLPAAVPLWIPNVLTLFGIDTGNVTSVRTPPPGLEILPPWF